MRCTIAQEGGEKNRGTCNFEQKGEKRHSVYTGRILAVKRQSQPTAVDNDKSCGSMQVNIHVVWVLKKCGVLPQNNV